MRELHTSDIKIEQKPTLIDGKERTPDIVLTDKLPTTDYLDELAFN